MIKITCGNIREYLLSKNLIVEHEDVLVEPIGGFWGGMGVSSTLIKIESPRNKLVLKQPLPELAVKDYWPCETSRTAKEKDCIGMLAGLIGEYLVPVILYYDKENHVLVMKLITSDWQIWKSQLLTGIIDERVPKKVAEVLAQIHNKTYKNKEFQSKFDDLSIFRQLRIDPYYKTVAQRHPDVAKVIEAELKHILNTRVCLVLGDYSPKNIFTKDGEIILLDHEIAHYGEPSVDFSFCLSHLLLKFIYLSIKEGKLKDKYRKVAEIYCKTYIDSIEFFDERTINANAVKNLGCFMLARIDGKSPVEYITDDKSKIIVRHISKNILFGSYDKLTQVIDMIEYKLQQAI